MWKYLRLHEAFIRSALAGKYGPVSFSELRSFHERQLARIQHERLIHLLVTFLVTIVALLTLGLVFANPSLLGLILVAVLMVFTWVYIFHYFRLENGVQRWYHLANQIERECGSLCALYEGGKIDTFIPSKAERDDATVHSDG